MTEPPRCGWATGARPLDVEYHDTEWGVPQRQPVGLFELLVLEGAQAGLSWSTILAKREGYRAAFAGFDPVRVAAFTEADVARCVADPGIVRHRGKIEATVGNARAWLELDDPVGFLWAFVDGAPIRNRPATGADVPASDERSERMSRELQPARLPLRRSDDLLRLHASVRPRQRPPHHVLPRTAVRRAGVSERDSSERAGTGRRGPR